MTRRFHLLAALAPMLLVSCGGGGGSSPPPPPSPPPANAPPLFSGAQANDQTAPENTTLGLVVAVSDPEGAALTLTLSGPDAALFAMHSTARRLAFNPAPDFETPRDADRNNRYEVSVTASDGANAVSKAFSVTVTDAAEVFETNGAVMVRVPRAAQIYAGVSLGDIDDDGRPELAWGVHRASTTYVISGAAIASLGVRVNPLDGISRKVAIAGAIAAGTSGGRIGAGDLDGDRRQDLFIGEPFFFSGPFLPNPRTVFVRAIDIAAAFGGVIEASQPAAPVTQLEGAVRSISVIGDATGDGAADLVITNPAEMPGGRTRAGVAYVLSGAPVNAALRGVLGVAASSAIRILGPETSADLGTSSAALQDFDGDGRGDLVLAGAAETASPNQPSRAYLISGSALRNAASSGVIDLSASTMPPGVVRFTSPAAKSLRVASAGDINGDGRTDILLGSMNKTSQPFPGFDPTVGYLFFGGALSQEQDLNSASTLAGAVRFRLTGADNNAGFGVASAGDVDRDGRPDILIGDVNGGGISSPGVVYLLFGSSLQSPGVIDLGTLATTRAGVRILGAHRVQNLNTIIGPAGDFNGDGHDDVVIAGRALDNDAEEVLILSGKMLAQERTLDNLTEIGLLFPELVEP